MSHGSCRGYAVKLVGNGACRSGTAADVGRSRTCHCACYTLSAAGAKLQHSPSACCTANAVGLCGNKALVVKLQKEIGLYKLCLYGGCAHGDEGFSGEYRRSFRNRPDIAGKLKLSEVVKEAFIK